MLSLIGGGVLGCGEDKTTAISGVAENTQVYWALVLNQHAVNLALVAPYNTVRLSATPYTAIGTPIFNSAPVRFQAADSSVTVDSTGVVTAHFATLGGPVSVIASLTVHGVTLQDTALIQVTAAALSSPLQSFSLQPMVGDSAKRSVDFGAFSWAVTATDAMGDTLCNQNLCSLQVYYTSSNPQVATIGETDGFVQAIAPGHVTFTATTLAYGVSRTDSVMFDIGFALFGQIVIFPNPSQGARAVAFQANPKVTLGVGAVVEFWNRTPHSLDIAFDDSAAADSATCQQPAPLTSFTGAGNIVAFGGDPSSIFPQIPYINDNDIACRRFLSPGLYRVYSTSAPSDTILLEFTSH